MDPVLFISLSLDGFSQRSSRGRSPISLFSYRLLIIYASLLPLKLFLLFLEFQISIFFVHCPEQSISNLEKIQNSEVTYPNLAFYASWFRYLNIVTASIKPCCALNERVKLRSSLSSVSHFITSLIYSPLFPSLSSLPILYPFPLSPPMKRFQTPKGISPTWEESRTTRSFFMLC